MSGGLVIQRINKEKSGAVQCTVPCVHNYSSLMRERN